MASSVALRDSGGGLRPNSPSHESAPGTGEFAPVHGLVVGGYELVETIAEGGMGVVYKARDRLVHRTVALKMISSARAGGTTAARRFRIETEAAAALDHPNIVPIYEVGEADGQPFFTMKLVEGGSLASRLEAFHRDPRAGARLMAAVARAIHHAHQRGVLHRDLKPANILLNDRNEPFVTDFGLALRFEENHDLTRTGAIMGTPNYMAPEQASGNVRQLTTAADIFSLGAILYHLLAGVPPFQATTVLETLRLVKESEPATPGAINQNANGDLETICLKCLEKDPRNRYQTALELAEDLDRWLADETILARRATPRERALKWVRRKPLVAALAAAVVVAIFAGVAGVFWQWRVAEARGNAEARARAEAQRQHEQAEAAYRGTAALLTGIELEKADALLGRGNSSGGLAYLARVLRREPANGVAAGRIMSFLNRHALPLRELKIIGDEGRVIDSALSPDHRLVAEARDQEEENLWLRDLDGGDRPGAVLTHPFEMPRLGPGRDRNRGGGDGSFAPGGPPGSYPAEAGLNSSDMGPFNARLRPITIHFSANGQRLITGSLSGRLRVWDPVQARPVTDFMETGRGTMAFSFGPNDETVLTLSRPGQVSVWNARSGQFERAFPTLRGPRLGRFNADGSRLLVASPFGGVAVWDTRSGQVVARWEEFTRPVSAATWSADGGTVALAAEGSAWRWRPEPASRATNEFKHPAGVTDLALSADGRVLATSALDVNVRLWDAGDGRLLVPPLVHPGAVLALVFSPDAKRLATLCRDNLTRLWDTATGQLVCEPIVTRGLTLSAHFTRDGQGLTLLCRDGSVLNCRVATPPPAFHSLSGTASATAGGFSLDGDLVFTAGADGTVRFHDARSGQLRPESIATGGVVTDVSFSPDGGRLVTAEQDGVVKIWTFPAGEMPGKPLRHSSRVLSARFRADGEAVIVLTEAGLGRIWNARTGEPMSPERDVPRSERSAFSPAAGLVLVDTGRGRAAGLYDLQSGERVGPFMKHAQPVTSLGFSPDGKAAITASADNTARIWDGQTAKPLTSSLRHGGEVSFASFSPDGRLAVTVSQDKTARLWNPAEGAALRHTLEHSATARYAEFSQDSRLLLTVADDFTVHVWDVTQGLRRADPLPHTSQVLVAHFSPDGQTVLTISKEDGARLWPIPSLPLPAPEWLADLAELIGGERIDTQGLTQPAAGQSLVRLLEKVAAHPGSDFYREHLAWLLQPPKDLRR